MRVAIAEMSGDLFIISSFTVDRPNHRWLCLQSMSSQPFADSLAVVPQDIFQDLIKRDVAPDTDGRLWPTEAILAGPGLDRFRHEVIAALDTTGYVVVRLPVGATDHELTIASWNLLGSIGAPIAQYASGELIYSVKVAAGEAAASSHYSNSAATGGFHTDGSLLAEPPTVAALTCLVPADEGGETVLVPAETIIDRLSEVGGALAALQSVQPFAASTAPEELVLRAPVLDVQSPAPFRYLRRYIEAGHQLEGSNPTLELMCAFDVIDEFVVDPDHQIAVGLRRGEMLIWRNGRFIHGRRPFATTGASRHLVRIYAVEDRPAN